MTRLNLPQAGRGLADLCDGGDILVLVNIPAKTRPMVRGASFPRPVLLTLAVLFAATVILYSAIWMYAVRWETDVRLGVNYQYSTTTRSARITAVGEGGPAGQAGLVVDDQIVAVNGRSLETLLRFRDAVYRGQPGDVVSLTVERPGEPLPCPST